MPKGPQHVRSAECGTRSGEWKKNDLQPLFVDSAFRAPRSTIGDALKAGQGEMKDGPWAGVGAGANPPSVFLDDRLADGQPQARAAALRSEKRLEDAIQVLSLQSDAGILNRHRDGADFIRGRAKDQRALLLGNFVHGVGGM